MEYANGKEAKVTKYYVDHYSRMTKDAEFRELTDALINDGLISNPNDRKTYLARRSDGRFTERRFPYLWDDRREAEEFAAKLNIGKAIRKPWVVREFDGIPISEMLKPSGLNLPDRPKVVAIEPRLYTDSLGDDALDVRVIFSDDVKGDELDWDHLNQIDGEIRDSLLAQGVSLWPYFNYRRASEVEASGSGR